MSSKKLKEKKKQDRKKKVEQKVFVRREALRKERKALTLQQRQEEEAQKLVNGRIKPIVNNYSEFEDRELKDKLVVEQLERNLKLLEALEQDYDREQNARQNINDTLESEGHLTMAEKMEALHQKALEMAREKSSESSGNEQNLSQEENL